VSSGGVSSGVSSSDASDSGASRGGAPSGGALRRGDLRSGELRGRALWLLLAASCLALFINWSLAAPEHLPVPILDQSHAGPLELWPFGADSRGRPLLAYATQGARVVALPAVVSGVVVAVFAILGGLLRAAGWSRTDAVIAGFSEVVSALPRMVVILVVALIVPRDLRGLLPLAVVWAVLAAPGAMDEAAALAHRLGGARFVEALRAHGFSSARIYLVHVVMLNLRPVVVRQAAEVMMQVVFLEIALSYLALAESEPSLTHLDNQHSWADLLSQGYPALVLDGVPTMHALALGLGLVAMVALMSHALERAARAR